jgi:low affinity Fe/Cu permease
MVFLIQNTQNRDNRAIQAKLDELIIHVAGADNKMVIAEDLSDEQLHRLKERFEKIAQQRQRRGGKQTVPPSRTRDRAGR